MCRTDIPYSDIVSSLLRKMCGILLQHKNDASLKQKLYNKQSHEATFYLTTLDPEYPAETLPNLPELYRAAETQSDQFIDLKLSLLAWMVGVDRSVVAAIPHEYLISLLTLVYLHEVTIMVLDAKIGTNCSISFQKELLTTFQADAILIVVHESMTGRLRKNVPVPRFCNETLLKKSFLYVKTWYWVACGLLAIGLTKVPKNIHWDGVYFHELALESPKQLATRLKAVQHLRVYDAKRAQ
jgi:hypothetical protein